jgi:hypothetical protein
VAAPKTPMPSIAAQTGRKVTRTITVNTGTAALEVADAIARRTDPPMTWEQVDPDFTAERIAGPRNTNARWRFNIPGQMLVVAEGDLPIIKALIQALEEEKVAKQL